MQKAHLKTHEAGEAISLDFKSLEVRKVEIGDVIDAPTVLFSMPRIRLKRPKR